MRQKALKKRTTYILECLKQRQNRDEDYDQLHNEMIAILPDIFNTLHYTAANEELREVMDSIVYHLDDFYQFSLQSLYELEFYVNTTM